MQISSEISRQATYVRCFGSLPLICMTYTDMGAITTSSIINSISGLLAFVSTVTTTIIVCRARKAVRERDSIPPGSCGACDDCCVSYFCQCCALHQIFVQESVSSKNYKLCSATGTVEI